MAHKTCFSWNPSVSFKKSDGSLIFLDESHQYRLSSINGMDVDSFNEALQNPHSDESEELQRVRLSLLKHRFLLDSEQVEMCKQHPNLAYFARYTDHPLLMQERLIHATVVVLGCGGIGSVVAQALAAMGVGTIVLVDYDPIGHSLVFNEFSNSNIDWDYFTYGQRPFATASVVLALYHHPALFHWKYRDVSSYDAVYAEAGAVIMGIALQASEFNLVVVPTNAMKTEILDTIFPPSEYGDKYPLFLVAIGYPDISDNEDYAPEIMSSVFGRKVSNN